MLETHLTYTASAFAAMHGCEVLIAMHLFGAAEYIQDTEEYINIELDSSRNRLIRLEVVINTATFSIAMYSLVAGERL